MSFSLDAYQAWRQRQESDCLLHEGEARKPKELLLQYIWQHQRLNRHGLQTLDGRQCEVLHPGFWNHGPGPDFSGALIRFDGSGEISGDVEIDCEVGGWQAHGHEGNPDFSNVVLQVVWAPSTKLPNDRAVLVLDGVLDDSLEQISELYAGHGKRLPDEFSGKCCRPLFDLPVEGIRELLRAAARLRFRQKGELLEARARQVGWEQALWEGMLGGLGYSKNYWPMRCVGDLTPRLFPGFPRQAPGGLSGVEVEARLYGIAGFLPKDPNLVRPPYLAQLWDVWWRVRHEFLDLVMPEAIWKVAGIRPHNHPHRRLALVARWIQRPDFFGAVESWFATVAEREFLRGLEKALAVETPNFWSTRFHISRESLGVSPNLLGEPRIIDLAVNVLLPWFWVRARAGQRQAMMDRAERLFLSVPRGEENRLLKDGRDRLMGRCDGKALEGAADQQGLLQILRDFCAHSNALCEDCRFPDLVRAAGIGSMG